MSYSGRRVVDDVSFEVAPGSITAVLGPNGAGKTTTVECCEGLRSPDAGTITVLGEPRASRSLRHRVGVMLQDGGLPMGAGTREVLAHVAALHRDPRPVDELLGELGLAGEAKTRVRHLSGGQRQRLAFACAMIGRPELAFLDEPSAGLDPASRQHIHSYIRALADNGMTIVLTTHLMAEAELLADQVIVLRAGRVVADGAADSLLGVPAIWVDGGRPGTMEALAARLPEFSLTATPQSVLIEVPGGATPAHLARVAHALDEMGENEVKVALRQRTLEDLYFDVVKEES
ncbi:MAG: ABC transporter ATP-binding protein [Flaviflexus sp.]|nr:ABC transporter ATP-binding protein [Flaviflexus sp.]